MKKPKRSMRYRTSAYRKNRIKTIFLTAAVTFVCLSLVFLIAGNILGSKVKASEESRKKKETTEATLPHAELASVLSFGVPLDKENSYLSTRIKNASGAGYNAACFYLDASDGTLLYTSSSVQKPQGVKESGTHTLKNAVSQFDSARLYTTGITHVSGLNSEDDLARSVAIGYHASLIAEALRAGVDDVLIYTDAASPQRQTELIRLADEVHRLCPEDGAIGISLSPSFFEGEDAEERFELIWSAFDYIAVDLTAQSENTTQTEYTDVSLGSMLYYLLRYNIRVLLPNADADALAPLLEAVRAKGTENIQVMP